MVRQYDLYLFFLEQGLERLYLKVFDHIRGGGGGLLRTSYPPPPKKYFKSRPGSCIHPCLMWSSVKCLRMSFFYGG